MVQVNGQELICADTFDGMQSIPDGSVDMVLCDLPYGTTQNKWDTVIPFEPLWAEYWRVCKPNAAIVLTAQPPFDKVLGASQIRWLKYEWIWEKGRATGHLNAKRQPMKAHENVLVFYKKQCTYRPIMGIGPAYSGKSGRPGDNYGEVAGAVKYDGKTSRYPRSVVEFSNADISGDIIHPTQKPVALFEYMIRTYTNPGETVLDNTAGSCTTAIAAMNTGRKSICIERDAGYFMQALGRVAQHEVPE